MIKREQKPVKLSEIKPNPDNPRVIKRNQLKSLQKSLNDFPEMMKLRPIVVDEDGVILGGNMRYQALLANGATETEVEMVSGLTPEQKREFVIKDNVAFGDWDWDKLANEWDMGQLNEWGLDIPEFEVVDQEVKEVKEDEAPEVKDGEPKAKMGDIYQLGRHRLMCGDSTDVTVIDRLMDGVKADMVFTDPPYGVDYKGINNDSRDELSDLLNGAFATAMANTKQGGSVYCFHSDKCADIFQNCFRKYCHFSSMIIWKKSSLVLSQTDYQSIHEPCLYGWFNNGTHNFYGDRKQTSVWEFDRENIDGHTTPKPIGFIAKALQNSSREGEIVLDVFGGSGSTLIACEQLNRKCYMMELDPHYVDVIIQRWENFTGKKAEKIN